jgi:chromate reductase
MKLLMIAASLRKDSYNKKLINVLTQLAQQQGIQVDYYRMEDHSLPLYNGDIESTDGVPEGASIFAEKMASANGTVISSPEYNFSIPGVLKNLIDWVSRLEPMPFDGKNIFLSSTSPSLVGGNRGLWAVRVPLESCGAFVYPKMFSLSSASNSFTDTGELKDQGAITRLSTMFDEFTAYIS